MFIVAQASGATEAATQAGGQNSGSMVTTLVYLAVMVAVFYFLLIRPQKKREKETRRMLDEMRSGDEVITIGGIMGKVLTIKDDRVVIETGANKTKLTFERSAVKTVLTVHDDEEDDEYEYEYEIEEEEATDKKSKKK